MGRAKSFGPCRALYRTYIWLDLCYCSLRTGTQHVSSVFVTVRKCAKLELSRLETRRKVTLLVVNYSVDYFMCMFLMTIIETTWTHSQSHFLQVSHRIELFFIVQLCSCNLYYRILPGVGTWSVPILIDICKTVSAFMTCNDFVTLVIALLVDTSWYHMC